MSKTYSFISGATGGIGKAFCYALAKQNNNLFLTGRSEEKLETLKSDLKKANENIDIICFACDLTSDTDRQKMFDYIRENDLLFSYLCNVAGVDTQMGFNDYTRSKMLFQIRVNVEGTIDITKEILRHVDKGLKIITISSMSGVSPMPYFALYSASKSMLTNFFTSLHYELKKEGIKVTTVLPAGVYTRPDICMEIKTQGLWGKITAKTPEYIASKSIKAVNKNKIKLIPGFWNRVLYRIMHIIPKGIVLRFIAHRWKTHSKDAFI